MSKYRDIAGMVFPTEVVEGIADFLLHLKDQPNLDPVVKLLGSKPLTTTQFDI